MKLRTFLLVCLVSAALGSGAAAFSDVRNSDPAQWSGVEVHQILNDSPWAKTLKMNFYENSGALGNQTIPSNNTRMQMPGGMGGTSRRGMGGGSSGGTYNSGSPRNSGGTTKTEPTEVTVQWQSALVVRMANAKKAGEPTDAAGFKPLDEYVIAVIGLPTIAVGGRAASVDSDNTTGPEEQQRIQENVKSSAAIVRPGHETLTPTKVELDQGKDGRMLIHFSKADPISVSEKSVEFRLGTGRNQMRKKFTLKDMEYQGKLEI